MRLFRYFKPYLWLTFLLLILVTGQVIANLTLPDYMAKIIDQGIVGKDSSAIYHFGLLMLFITLVGGVLAVGVGYLSARIGTGYARTIRDKVFVKIENFSLVEFSKFSTASLITRNTNDVQQIQTALIILLRLALMAPLMGVVAILKAYHLAPSMTWIMVVAIVILVMVIAAIFLTALPKFKKLQALVDRLNLTTREILTGLRVIRAFDKEGYEEGRFAEVNRDLTAVNLFVNRLMAVLQPAMMLIMNFTVVGVVWIGAHQIDMGNLQIGSMLAFMQYAMQAILAFLLISIVFVMVPRASVSAKRLAEVLSVKETVRDPENPRTIERGGGKIEFEGVSFAYEGAEKPVLQNISFSALPGETTAIVGSTGSGKSTIVNLIPRLHDVTAGRILIDGVDIREITQSDLRARIGYVSQKAMLFSGTIKENIAYGRPDIPFDEVARVATIAQASEFINNLDKKYETPIAQAGANLSGGQKQRLSIARALAKNPEIYIFDDSFSALDFKTDAALRGALEPEIKDKTILIVAQRISTIMHAEKIVVLEAGKVVGIGTHAELLQSCPVYQEIASSQLSEEELSGVSFESDTAKTN